MYAFGWLKKFDTGYIIIILLNTGIILQALI